MSLTLIALGLAAFYCLTRGIMDLRQRRYAWGAAGLLCGALGAALLLLTPIPTHAVKLDLPQAPAN